MSAAASASGTDNSVTPVSALGIADIERRYTDRGLSGEERGLLGHLRNEWGSMKISMIALGGLVVTGLVVGVSVVGCGTNKSSTTSSATKGPTSSPSSAPSADYTGLLIKASDIVLPGDTFTAQPPIQNPNGQPGVAQIFSNQNDTRHVGSPSSSCPTPIRPSASWTRRRPRWAIPSKAEPLHRRQWAPAERWSRAPHRMGPRQ